VQQRRLAVGLIVVAEDALLGGLRPYGRDSRSPRRVRANRGQPRFAASSVVIAAIVGDSVCYEVGRIHGPRILRRSLAVDNAVPVPLLIGAKQNNTGCPGVTSSDGGARSGLIRLNGEGPRRRRKRTRTAPFWSTRDTPMKSAPKPESRTRV